MKILIRGGPLASRKAARAGMMTALVLLALTACSTFEARVAENRALYQSLDPATRQKLSQGIVEIGYTPSMAYIALGSPDVVRRVTTVGGESLHWYYQYVYPVYEGDAFVGFEHFFVRTPHGARLIHVPAYRERYRYETRDYLRLEFERGKIMRIERIQ